jgi:hypothetical protein
MNRYEIQVVGHLDARRARSLGADECRRLSNGDSILVVSAVDRAATYGLLARLRDAGVELIALRPIRPAPSEHDGAPEQRQGEDRDDH